VGIICPTIKTSGHEEASRPPVRSALGNAQGLTNPGFFANRSNSIGCRAKSVTISVRLACARHDAKEREGTSWRNSHWADVRNSRIRRSFPPHGALRITLRSCSSYRDFQRLRGRPPLVSPLKSWSAAALAEASFCAALTSRSWLNAFVLVIGTLTSAERAAARFTSLKNSLRRCGSSSHLAVLLDV